MSLRLHEGPKFLTIVRFAQEPVGAGSNALHPARMIGEGGHEHDRQQACVRPPLELPARLEAVQPGHHDVHHHQVCRGRRCGNERVGAAADTRHEIPVLVQQPLEKCPPGVLIVDDQDARRLPRHVDIGRHVPQRSCRHKSAPITYLSCSVNGHNQQQGPRRLPTGTDSLPNTPFRRDIARGAPEIGPCVGAHMCACGWRDALARFPERFGPRLGGTARA